MSEEQKQKEALEIVPTEQIVPNSMGEGTRSVLRGPDGKFFKKITGNAKRSLKAAQDFLNQRDGSGETLEERLRKHLANVAMKCSPEDLNAAVKAVELLDKLAYGKLKTSLTEDKNTTSTPISVVLVTGRRNSESRTLFCSRYVSQVVRLTNRHLKLASNICKIIPRSCKSRQPLKNDLECNRLCCRFRLRIVTAVTYRSHLLAGTMRWSAGS